MIGGAVLGAVAGYLFFSDEGRALRRQLEPALERFARELTGFRVSIHRAVEAVAEGWNLPGEGGGPARRPSVH